MKTLRILILFFVIAVSANAQIPNASFEDWYNYSLGEYPTGWTTSDSVAAALGGTNNAYKGVDAFDGNFALHLKSVSVGFVNGPGVATNGKVALVGASFAFSGGTPETSRPRFMTGQFKYMPLNPNDEGQISILLSKDNAGVKDTIAVGVYTFSGTVSTYTPFLLTLYYQDYTTTPDTCLIIIQSSRAINDPNLGIGTELIIDSIGYLGTVGIEEANDVINSVDVFPSPAQTHLTVSVDLKRKTDISCTIYDLTGKQVLVVPFKSEKEIIDISSLANGNYILKLNDEKNRALYSKNFIKE